MMINPIGLDPRRANQLGIGPVTGNTTNSSSLPAWYTATYGTGTPSWNPNSTTSSGGWMGTGNVVTAPVTVPVGQGQTTGGGNNSNTMTYFQSIAALVSQALAGFSRNPTNQVVGSGVGVINNPNVALAQAQAQQYQYAAAASSTAANAATPNNGGIAEDFMSQLTGFVSKYPIYILGGAIAVYLLMKPPPKYGNR